MLSDLMLHLHDAEHVSDSEVVRIKPDGAETDGSHPIRSRGPPETILLGPGSPCSAPVQMPGCAVGRGADSSSPSFSHSKRLRMRPPLFFSLEPP